MKIVKLHTNYHECGERGDIWGDDYDVFEVGKKEVVEIIEYIPCNPSERWCYDIKFEDGSMQRSFNPDRVFFEPAGKGANK